MDYQHISGVTKSINELTQAVTTPSEVSITITDLATSLQKLDSSEAIISTSFIAAGSAILASIITFLFQILIQAIRHKKEKTEKENSLKLAAYEEYTNSLLTMLARFGSVFGMVMGGQVNQIAEAINIKELKTNYLLHSTTDVLNLSIELEEFMRKSGYKYMTSATVYNQTPQNIQTIDNYISMRNDARNESKERILHLERLTQTEAVLSKIELEHMFISQIDNDIKRQYNRMDDFRTFHLANMREFSIESVTFLKDYNLKIVNIINQMRKEMNKPMFAENPEEYAQNAAKDMHSFFNDLLDKAEESLKFQLFAAEKPNNPKENE